MTRRQRIYSYGFLLAAAGEALERAEQGSKPPFIDSLNTVLHCALALEAFLNHIGAQSMPHWPPLKKKLSPTEKLEVLAAHYGFSISWEHSPYQSFSDAMAFRNLIVHAETEIVQAPKSAKKRELPHAKWQSYCTISKARRILADTRTIVQELPQLTGVEPIPSFLLSEAIE
jgi:hypothetical protein